VRIGPNELAFNTPQAFRDIYGYRANGTCFPKDRSHYEPPANGVDHLVCAVDDASHTRQRRLLSHAFSEKALKDQEGLIRGYADTLVTKLRAGIRHGTCVVDIKAWMNFTTFDITGDLMFGASFGCLKDSQLHPWIGMIFKSMKAIAFIGAVNQFPALKWLLDMLLPSEVKRVGEEHFQLSAQKADRRLDATLSRPDFMTAILQNGLSEEKGEYTGNERVMTRAEIHSNSFMWVSSLLTILLLTVFVCRL
jgi:cytochrome P450